MNQSPDEHDLRAAFAQQRRVDHADAPVWRGEWLCAPAVAKKPGRLRRWLPQTLGAACAALAAVAWLPTLQPQPRLSDALPPLFDPGPGELFADLGPSFMVVESPSDFLLPDRFQSNHSLIDLP